MRPFAGDVISFGFRSPLVNFYFSTSNHTKQGPRITSNKRT
jgi:hypothetical protein